MDDQSVDAYRNGFLCLLVCTALGIWFFMRIIKNRRKFNHNMELIGHELKRMEDKIRNSGNGTSEDEESLLADQSGMGLVDLLNQLKELEEEEMKRKLEKEEEISCPDDEEDVTPVQDKKND
ncbi:uncharacterized protein LOC123318523 [Coccinella septempunctata]|uniref:uncharacterized protein LOC123318523 n=1 Tax=Coccinella septempunctata TaxID=41139 RepID=UPI001D071082|nr:uncharacterized protein LOC123318523 [Coccinella septempunctata]